MNLVTFTRFSHRMLLRAELDGEHSISPAVPPLSLPLRLSPNKGNDCCLALRDNLGDTRNASFAFVRLQTPRLP